MNSSDLKESLQICVDHLLSLAHPSGYWEGHLSSSALSTSVAVMALNLGGFESDRLLVSSGLQWICNNHNEDGGWGDTPDSPSNLSTTLLVLSAIKSIKNSGWLEIPESVVSMAVNYVQKNAGSTPGQIAEAIRQKYGNDSTFAVPILADCAISGIVNWDQVPVLPYELALLPRSWYKAVRLQVVSYALPALIAVGLLISHHSPHIGPIRSMIRKSLTQSLLAKLVYLQPESGGFLEAAPLTGFVAMSLAVCGFNDSPVLMRCLEFLRNNVRNDGSWPIDTNLSVWVTSSAVSALNSANEALGNSLENSWNPNKTISWLKELQAKAVHPFTGAAPGGWAWTHLSGGVPDADDTSGVLRVLLDGDSKADICAGVRWLLDLQNTDGGWPTFCRGWGHLPFDCSSPDITAHALRALILADNTCSVPEIAGAINNGLKYLRKARRSNGSWIPLWFGCQSSEDHLNPVFGTARVLTLLSNIHDNDLDGPALDYLVSVQNTDGGWGGSAGSPSTVEETAVAVRAIAGYIKNDTAGAAIEGGLQYLISRIKNGTWTESSPLGLYFASLWYYEETYPVIWTVEALAEVIKSLN